MCLRTGEVFFSIFFSVITFPINRLLAELVDKHKEMVWNIHNHDSLLENKVDENLTEEERKAAWDEYDQEKKGLIQTNVGMENLQQFGMMLQTMLPKSGDGRIMASPINPMAIQAQLRQMNPELSHEELVSRTRAAIMQLQNMHRCTKILSLKIHDFYKSYPGLKPRSL